MKKLLLLWIFSGSLDSLSQVPDLLKSEYTLEVKPVTGEAIPIDRGVVKPDTLRAIVLVTLFPNGIAHSRMGFVVLQNGRKPVYLSCDKKPLKLPQVGWGYELVEPNRERR